MNTVILQQQLIALKKNIEICMWIAQNFTYILRNDWLTCFSHFVSDHIIFQFKVLAWLW